MNPTACDDIIVTEVSVETNPVSSLPLRHWVTCERCWAFVAVYWGGGSHCTTHLLVWRIHLACLVASKTCFSSKHYICVLYSQFGKRVGAFCLMSCKYAQHGDLVCGLYDKLWQYIFHLGISPTPL